MAIILGGSDIAAAWTQRELVSGQLHGTLTLPEGEGQVPAALILPGSGPVDRDGNLPNGKNESLKLIAHALAARHIATLRIDKRGIGESREAAPREDDLRFGTYVDDAINWIKLLQDESRVEAIYLIGHSEGALVATLVAQEVEVAGVVLLAGAGEPAGKLIGRQLAASGLASTLKNRSDEILASLEDGQHVADIPPELAALYRRSVQNYLTSWLPLDPVRELAKLSCPILIVQGTSDLQISMDDAKLLAAASPTARLVAVEGMNHVLKSSPPGRRENLLSYNNPDLPLADHLVPAIADFIGAP
ncbi:alpha/beta fold hydrolase [Neorhizobium sp. JUb45]|uniref:alpha/beta hydrolase n=1 Tax=Neorhizobium sp. JUb45 TaxID=2485113 RepID=UPI001051872D|nr:alpha/beta fold hydrolase [Neorhizobium sp. JUb45]